MTLLRILSFNSWRVSSACNYGHRLNFSKLTDRKYSSRSYKASPNEIGVAGICLLGIPIATFCLGTWQVQRRTWKLNLIKELEEKINVDPVELPSDFDELENMEYRKVKIRGRFDNSKEMYIRPRSLVSHGNVSTQGLFSSPRGSGVHVITPFHLSDRQLTVLVNRGWAPREWPKNPQQRSQGQINDEVELVGVIRNPEKRLPFMPKDSKEISIFFNYRDIATMANISNSSPIFIDADYHSTIEGGPIGGQTRVNLRNEHLSYIITWYSLCAATSFMWYKKYLSRTAV